MVGINGEVCDHACLELVVYCVIQDFNYFIFLLFNYYFLIIAVLVNKHFLCNHKGETKFQTTRF